MEYRRVLCLSTVFAFAFLLLHLRACFCDLKGPPNSLEDFFGFVDQDGDGEIELHEVTQFMASFGAEDFNEDLATRETTGDIFTSHLFNFSYGGNTISSEEMLDHLQNMLTADHVVEWIKHGLELPQYAEAFKNNSVNGLDFPSLIENGSWTLATELGVSSPLHCKKITYAIVRQIFGCGAPPGPPRNMTWKPLPSIGIHLHWNPPQFLGYPPLHKYAIYRRELPSSSWVSIAETKENYFWDNNIQADVVYSYRIQGWGGHGSSEWVTLTRCNVSRRIIVLKAGVRSDSSPSIDFHKQSMQTHSADAVDSYSSTSFSLGGNRVNERDALNEVNNFWGWMFSVNGGLLLLGILSRQSFLFRISLAAWVLFKVHVLQKIYLMVHQAQASQYRLLRALAHACIFADACFMCVQANIWLLSRQVTSIPPTLATLSSSNEKKFLSRTDTFQDAIGYSAASCTLDEMLEAIRKQQHTIRPIMSKDRIFEKVEWDAPKKISSSHLMSKNNILSADKNSPDFAIGLGKGLLQRVDVLDNLPYCKSVEGSTHKKKQVQSSVAIHRNEEEESNNGSSQVIDPLEARCLSAPACVDRFSHSASDSEYDQSVHGDNGHPEKLRAFDDARRQKPPTLINTKRTRSRCNQEGCRVRFDRWHNISDWHMRLSRHYCRECQRVFCVRHTRISPHGPRGQCGLDSNCYCSNCFQNLSKEVQEELESLNKLRVGPIRRKCPSTVKLFGLNVNPKSGICQPSSQSVDGGSGNMSVSSSGHSGNSGHRLNTPSIDSRVTDVQDQASVYGEGLFPLRLSKSMATFPVESSSSKDYSSSDGTGSIVVSNDSLDKVEPKKNILHGISSRIIKHIYDA